MSNGHHVCCKCGELTACGMTVGSGHFSWRGRDYRIERRAARFLRFLLERRTATLPQIINAVYGDDADGGPLDAEGCLYAYASRLRKTFATAGVPWTIVGDRYLGYTLTPRKEARAA